MADVDASLVQPILDVSERKRKANVHHHRQPDNFGATAKVLEGVCFRHEQRLRDRPAQLNRNPSDTARQEARLLPALVFAI